MEAKSLQHCQFPGINSRYGMPQTPPAHKASRESDLAAILSFSPLPPSETKRALILRSCEEMMKEKEKEREWRFMDRSYVEKYENA